MQVSLDPEIDHDRFRVYSGFGNQLGPIVLFGAAGVIDGMAAFYPKTVVRLMTLLLEQQELEEKQQQQQQQQQPTPEARAELRRLQFVVSRAEEFVMRYGVVGIKEAVCRVAGFGNLDGGRLPIRGRLPDGAWDKARALFLADIEQTEAAL